MVIQRIFIYFSFNKSSVNETVLTGCVTDQAALHGLLSKIRDIGLPLISVERIEDEEGLWNKSTDRNLSPTATPMIEPISVPQPENREIVAALWDNKLDLQNTRHFLNRGFPIWENLVL